MMFKNYYYIIILFVLIFTCNMTAQEIKQSPRLQETAVIEGLNLYPNPVTNGKVYISSKNDLDKSISIFNVLGEKVLETTMTSKELNISSLTPGFYIIKIIAANSSATRKLIIK